MPKVNLSGVAQIIPADTYGCNAWVMSRQFDKAGRVRDRYRYINPDTEYRPDSNRIGYIGEWRFARLQRLQDPPVDGGDRDRYGGVDRTVGDLTIQIKTSTYDPPWILAPDLKAELIVQFTYAWPEDDAMYRGHAWREDLAVLEKIQVRPGGRFNHTLKPGAEGYRSDWEELSRIITSAAMGVPYRGSV